MRDIKFRQWSSGSFHYWGHGVDCFTGPLSNRLDIPSEQFTGLHDKNGKEIYEGDILHGREEGDGETTAWTDVYFQIIYDEKLTAFMAHEIGMKNSSWDEQICELNSEYEILGNIHDNPELLNAH